jgi:hypothetical protein
MDYSYHNQMAEKMAAAAQYDSGRLNGPVREPEIPHQMERLERALKDCHQAVESLGARLESTVMRSEPPTPTGGQLATAAPSTPHASRLHDMATLASMLRGRIESITMRLEV